MKKVLVLCFSCILPLTSMSPSTRSGPLLLTPRHPPIVDRGGRFLQPPSPRGYTAAECELHLDYNLTHADSRPHPITSMQTENQRTPKAEEQDEVASLGQDLRFSSTLYCPLAFSASDLAIILGIVTLPLFSAETFIMMYRTTL